FWSDECRLALHGFLDKRRGLACLHQLRLAGLHDSRVQFLPEPLNGVRAALRPADESARLGRLCAPASASDQTLLKFPNHVEMADVQSQAVTGTGLKGLYWHHWADVNLADWDEIVVDGGSRSPRPLLLATKQATAARVVLTSLPLDWHRQRTL